MDTNKTSKFFVGSVITIILLLGLIKIILSGMLSIERHEVTPGSQTAEAIAERIKPVAQVTVGEAPAVQAQPVADAGDSDDSDDSDDRGKQIVSQICSMCHGSGLLGSPKLGNKKAWAPRIEKGVDTLYKHAMNGFNAMPARGGHPDLSDDDIKAAVNYMVSLVK